MSLLRELSGHAEYVALLAEAEKQRPQLPAWNRDDVTGVDNTDDWKHKSGMQQGFDLCLQIFRPK